jgi:copper chaperone CopZ
LKINQLNALEDKVELERILKFSVEDGKSLNDDEIIEVYKLIEANIEHVRFTHNDFFIYLSDRYLALSIAIDEKEREKIKSRKNCQKILGDFSCDGCNLW